MKLNIIQLLSKFSKSVLQLRLPYFAKKVLIVRLDFVGDYILFRNGLSDIKNSKKFKDYQFTLLGNVAFKDIAESYDQHVIDRFIWINPKILDNGLKKFILLLKLKSKAFHTVINPTHSRTIRTDLLIKHLNAKIALGSKGNELNPPVKDDKELSENCYTALIEVPDNSNFEFFRNIKLIENLIDAPTSGYELAIPVTKQKEILSERIKITIVPGASKEYRRWSVANFASLIQKLHAFYGKACIFYITGSKSETHLGVEILNKIKDETITIENLSGKTTLVETIALINNCNLLISNETGTVHIGAAVKTPVVCISNGNDFGRFNPYPEKIAGNIITLYPNDNFLKKENYLLNVKKYNVSDLNINDISIQTVFEAAITLLEPRVKTVQ